MSVRIAVIGAGVIGVRHIRELSARAGYQLAAVADPRPQAAEIAAAHGAPHFLDYREMIAAVELDGVVVASPNSLHVPMALACLERGLPALVEKPIADSLTDAIRLVEASRRTGVPVLVGHHRRHNPLLRRARQFIEEGGLGQLVAVSATGLRRKHDPYFDMAWRREPGGGPLLINGIHEIDCLRMLCGDIAGVQAAKASLARGFPVEDTAVATLRFANGGLGTLALSDAVQAPWAWELTSAEEPEFAWEPQNCYLICGTKASIAIPSLEVWHNAHGGGRADPMVRTRLYHVPADSLVEELAHFAAVIRREAEPLCSAEDASRSLATVLAMHRSADTGQLVGVDEVYDEALRAVAG